MSDAATRCAVVALVGAPNAGKSTLLNQAVGSKISIVTHKVQTTRTRVRGIALRESVQLIFVDTPGIFAARDRLQRAMVAAAWNAIQDADLVVYLFDAQRQSPDAATQEILQGLGKRARRRVLALNKVDAVPRESLLTLSATLNDLASFERTFMISALSGDGVGDLLDWLAVEAPEGPWLYPEDQVSDLPLRLLAAEVTREKLFLNLHQELPYALTVETEAWEEFKDGSVKIDQTIYLQRETQKRIAIGAGGRTIRKIREQAQAELQALIERPVHLYLFVKVRERWIDDPERYRDWGLDWQA
ncbi:GTPase Era [Algihabitans albus]|uniref:GTPase Era n=1 Tax=Algihabitans albus TaxID=2164067 RepID=UPI000E5C8C2C|nr:GTPase Era [Algihabitans albus]